MKKIFLLVAFFVLGKICLYAQYPLTQQLGSDSTIVISKGALQSRLINVTYTDTAAANLQRIRQYPAALIATTTGGLNLWVRNATATGWLPVATGSGNNIYTINGTLLGNRTLTGGGYPLTFTGLDKFVVSADSIRFTTGDLKFGLNTDSASLTKKISYSGNYRGDYKQFTLVDKGYVDSVVASSPAGTVTSIATNNGSGITGGTITSTGTLAIDTTNVISTKANVTSGLAGKLNISDTAAMLAPYLRAIDTTSLSNRINLKLNISDTASMLGNYLNNVGYGLSKAGQVVSADSATLSNYYLRRKDSLTTTNPLGYVTKQILADTAAAIRSADAGGTVTSVGLTMPAAFNVGNSPITTAGTISVTAAGLVSQYIRGDGTLADFPGGGGGGGASISYYLNGSVNQGTFGGNTYYEMNKTPIFGAGTDFSINADGYIAQFITDAGDPGLLKIPGGNWDFELFFNASSGGGTPTYYVELYKYDGTTFTLIASGSSNPDVITGGTSVEAYFSTLPVPETVLLATDRLAVRIYVTHAGRTITLHTEDNNLCQVITTFTTGITALNGLTEQVQYFATGTSGTDFNISSSVATHTFNLPTASATNRGALSTTDWTTFNNKVGGSLISGYIPKATGTNTIDTSQLFQNGQNVGIGTLTPNGRLAIVDTGGFALRINYNSASNVSDSNAAIYAENNGLSSYVAIFNEKTTNNTGAQLPLLIESSLTTGTPQANMGTGVDFGTRDDANNRKLNRFIIRGTDPAAATYTSRAEFRLWNNGVQTTPYYWLGNGNMGLGTSTPDSNLTVVNGAYFQRGIRASGLPAAPGTKALRIDASGTLSYADTLIDAGGTVTSVATNNGTGITGGTITTSGTLAIDTTLISTRAWRQKGIDSLQANINLKLNISDTASMLSPYLRSNTAAATYVPQTRTITINGTSQDLSANRTYNVGTVTSVATNTGTGITGGTFTTSGTIAADTLLLSTRAWRQKGIDSVAALINNNISGTTNFIPRFSSANVIGNSIMRQSGTSIGINTSPSYTLDILETGSANIGAGTANNKIVITGNDNGGSIATTNTTYINFAPFQVEAMRITSGGVVNMGANFTNNFNKLNVGGSATIGYTTNVVGPTDGLSVNGSVGIGLNGASTDSALSVLNGVRFQRGVRMSGLPSAVGTKSLRIDASGTLSIADTLANGVSGSGTINRVSKFTSSGAIGNSSIVDSSSTVAMTISSAGNIGLGITPSPWNIGFGSSYKALQFSNGVLNSFTGLNEQMNLALNWYYDNGDKYYANGAASIYTQSNGDHFWYTAPSGTANSAVTFTNRLALYNDGRLQVGAVVSDSLFAVKEGVQFFRGVRLSGLPTAPGTRALRINANGTLSVADTLTNGISGSGTTNYIPKFTSSSAIVNSQIFDNGTSVGIGTAAPSGKTEIFGSASGTTFVALNLRNTDEVVGSDASMYFSTGSGALASTNITGLIRSSVTQANPSALKGNLKFYVNSGDNVIEAMQLDASGNLGLGVTPSAWGSDIKAVQVGNAGSQLSASDAAYSGTNFLWLSNNSYKNSLGQDIYVRNATVGMYAIAGNQHQWFNAAFGTAGNAISFTQAMTLDASGRLGIGLTNPQELLVARLQTNGNLEFRKSQDIISNTDGIAIDALNDARNAVVSFGLRGNPLKFADATGTIMTITGGNVGIGTTSPNGKLEVAIGTGYMRLNRSGAGETDFSIDASGNAVYDVSIGAGQIFRTNGGSERMRITSGGQIGIGGIVPTGSWGLQMYGNGTVNTVARIRLQNSLTGSADSDGGGISMEGVDFVTNNNESGVVKWELGGSQRMLLDASGNLGLGITPSAWTSGNAIQIGSLRGLSLFGGTGIAQIANNVYYSSTLGGYFYGGTGVASLYTLDGGNHVWSIAPSGTVNTQISFTQAMTLDASGRLGIGATSPGSFQAAANNLVVGTGSGYEGITLYGGTTGGGSLYFADGTASTDGYRGYIEYDHTNDYMTFGTAALFAMRINSSGNVGIGTTNPVTNLDVNAAISGAYTTSSSQAVTRLYNITNAGGINSSVISFQASTDGGSSNPVARIGVVGESAGSNNGAMVMMTRDASGVTERMRITSGGNVGIGTQTPDTKLQVQDGFISTYHNANVNDAGYGVEFYTNGGGSRNTIAAIYPSQVGTSRSGNLYFLTSNSGAPTEKMRITSGGNVGINTQTPAALLDVNGTAKAAQFNSTTGTISVPVSTNTTFFTPSSAGLYMAHVYLPGNATQTWDAVIIFAFNATNILVVNQTNSANVSTVVNGTSIQVRQIGATTFTFNYEIIKIG